MKIDFSARLKTLDGKEIQRAEKGENGETVLKPWPVGEMVADALLAADKSAASATPQPAKVAARYALALRVYAGGVQDVSAEEVLTIQQAVACGYPPLIAGQIVALTEGAAGA